MSDLDNIIFEILVQETAKDKFSLIKIKKGKYRKKETVWVRGKAGGSETLSESVRGH